MKKRRVVYTAIFGGKDLLNEPRRPSPFLDYVAFTDDVRMYSDIWKVVVVPRPAGFEPSRVSRFYKIFPQFVLPQYEASLWVDGNIELIGDTQELFDKYLAQGWVNVPPDFGQGLKWAKRDIYDEARHCIHLRKDDPEAVEKHISRCRREGHPERFGLWQNMLILRDHYSTAAARLCSVWWAEYLNGCMRDQISFPHAVYKCGALWPQTFEEADLYRHIIRYGHRS